MGIYRNLELFFEIDRLDSQDAVSVEETRQLGKKLQGTKRSLALLSAWNEAFSSRLGGSRGRLVRRLLSVERGLYLFALFFGFFSVLLWLAAGTQSRPISLFPFLLVYVVIPFFWSLIGLVLTLGPGSTHGNAPQDSFWRYPLYHLILGAYRLAARLLVVVVRRWMPRYLNRLEAMREKGEETVATLRRYPRLWSRYLLVKANMLAAFLSLGVLAGILAMAVFSSPAFVWSSSILSSETLMTVLKWLALPWGWLAPEAIPNDAMIEASHYFGVSGVHPAMKAHPELLVDWWRYLAYSVMCYGVIFRVLVAIVAYRLFSRELLRTFESRFRPLIQELRRPIDPHDAGRSSVTKEEPGNRTNTANPPKKAEMSQAEPIASEPDRKHSANRRCHSGAYALFIGYNMSDHEAWKGMQTLKIEAQANRGSGDPERQEEDETLARSAAGRVAVLIDVTYDPMDEDLEYLGLLERNPDVETVDCFATGEEGEALMRRVELWRRTMALFEKTVFCEKEGRQ